MNLGMVPTGFTVWFTGMAGAGKSTLANALANRLRRLGQYPEAFDGPPATEMLGIGNAQTKDERNAEVKKLSWVCGLVTRAGGIAIQSAVISPYREARDEARRHIHRFCEVFVECPTETLISRDKSGQYKKALAGEIKNLPGISEPYEPPTHPEVIVDTSKYSVDEAVEHLVQQLVALRLLDPNTAGMKSRPKPSARSKAAPKGPPPKAPKAAVATPKSVVAKAINGAKEAVSKVLKSASKPASVKPVKASSKPAPKASKPAAKKPAPAPKRAARPEPRRAAGGRRR